MISVNLMGGLGNQMFQIMTAYAHSKDVQDDLYFDFQKCHTPNQGNVSELYLDNFLKNLKGDKQENHSHILYNEPKFSFSEIPKEKHLLLNGYFQSEKYFSKYKSDTDKIFNIDSQRCNYIRDYLVKKTNSENLTSVHVRRGDYLTKPNYHFVLSLDYYKKAIDSIIDSKFIIVSDDIEWCKKEFSHQDVFFTDFTKDLDDLYLMMMCNNKIISNSSFSWWAVYLSNIIGEVVSPKNWFGPDGPQDTQDIYNKGWKIL